MSALAPRRLPAVAVDKALSPSEPLSSAYHASTIGTVGTTSGGRGGGSEIRALPPPQLVSAGLPRVATVRSRAAQGSGRRGLQCRVHSARTVGWLQGPPCPAWDRRVSGHLLPPLHLALPGLAGFRGREAASAPLG